MKNKDLQGSKSSETISCHSIFITFDQEGAISQAFASKDIEFQSGSSKGTCQEAEFISGEKHIIMREQQNQPPFLAVDDWSVYAQEIVIKGRNEISASGIVKTLYQEKDCHDCQIPLFQSDKTVFITSDNLDISKGEEALYSGHVRAWQEENSIEAQKIHIFFKRDIFEAHGKVISRFSRLLSANSKEEGNTDPIHDLHKRVEVQSDHLIYSSKEHKATYIDQVILQTEENQMNCSEMDILFSDEGEAERIEARSDIQIESRDFKAEGDLLEYLLTQRSGYLHGTLRPARVYTKSGSEMAVGASLTFHLGEDNINLLSRDEGRTWMIFK